MIGSIAGQVRRVLAVRRAATFLCAALLLNIPAGAEAALSDQPGADLEALLASIPSNHRDNCRADMPSGDDLVVMRVACDLPSGLTVYYTQLPSAEAMAERFANLIDQRVGLEETGNDCSTDLPSEHGYTVGGVHAGELLCYASSEYLQFDWTHEDAGILAGAIYKGELDELWSWWLAESGPITPDPQASPTGRGADLDELIARVPQGHRGGCLPFDGGGLEDGVLASLRCHATDEVTVYYDLFDSVASLTTDYEDALTQEGIAADSGDCAEAFPAEQGYTIGGESAGRVYCTTFFDDPWIRWTHQPTLIGATISSDLDAAESWDWWLAESGPLP